MAKKAQEYGDHSISSLKGADRVRKRPAVIFGSDGLDGCQHSFFEILSNSVDEAREGNGRVIKVTVFSDRSLQVEDFGRGIPLDWNEREGRYNWDLIYCELYAGGKYNNAEGGMYEYSLGLNGLGACATQYSSEYFEISSYRSGIKYSMSFKKGEPVGELRKEKLRGERTGTVQRWKPDLEVFTDIAIPHDYFKTLLKKQSVVNAGISFELSIEQPDGSFERTVYVYENGILDYVTELAGEDSITSPVYWQGEKVGRDRADKNDYKLKMQVCLCFSNTTQVVEYYHNSSFLEHGGSPDKALRSALLWAVDGYLKNNGKYLKNEAKISYTDIEDCLVCVISSFSNQTSYANQTKKAITNVFIAEAMTEFLKNQLEVYFTENPADAEKIAGQILINKRSRENAESARINIKKKLTATLDISNRVEKFVNCRTKDATVRELYIVEGDSALTSCKLARDSDFQAIIPVRGKTLNCLKSTYDKIFKNEIIMDLLRVIGCGVEIKSRSRGELSDFDLSALRWSKIIICTDADEDGYQIRTLILTMFYRLLPTLIKERKVFIAESPLYEITVKNDILFAYNDKEKNDILTGLKGQKATIQRSKGLGENEPDMMSRTTMAPATRRLICVTQDDAHDAEAARMFDILLGDNLEGRKDYIANYGSRYIELADV
ncbi:MAG: toprim domain-containing protein [Eubacteriales bacterium]